MDTGTRLKLVRERNKLSQRELARRSGLTNSTISQIEQNRVSPSVSSLKKLLEGIPMSLAEFFSFDEPIREERFVFRSNEQPDLGNSGLRMLLSVPASKVGRCACCANCTPRVPTRVMSPSSIPKAKNAAW